MGSELERLHRVAQEAGGAEKVQGRHPDVRRIRSSAAERHRESPSAVGGVSRTEWCGLRVLRR